MPLEIEKKRRSVIVSGEMNIYSAREGFDKLLPLLRESAATSLDLGQVTEFDSSGLQLLLMASREAEAAGKKFQIRPVSAPVLEALELLQCEELLSRIRSAA